MLRNATATNQSYDMLLALFAATYLDIIVTKHEDGKVVKSVVPKVKLPRTWLTPLTKLP